MKRKTWIYDVETVCLSDTAQLVYTELLYIITHD